MRILRTLRIGDLLTSLTLLISATGLVISWAKDRTLQTRRDADHIRAAAAKCITKLDRWQGLQLAVFGELQASYVETSERMAEHPDDRGGARDYLWKAITRARASTTARVSQEQIETAYADLLASFPPSRRLFVSTLRQLREVERSVFDDLLVDTQRAVRTVSLDLYVPPVLGNALRRAASRCEERFLAETTRILDRFRARFNALIELPDDDVLSARWNVEPDARAPPAPATREPAQADSGNP